MVVFLPRCTLSRAADSGMRPSSCCRRRTTSIFCLSLIKSLISNNLTTLICLLHSKIQVLRQTLPTRLLANSPTLYISATPPTDGRSLPCRRLLGGCRSMPDCLLSLPLPDLEVVLSPTSTQRWKCSWNGAGCRR